MNRFKNALDIQAGACNPRAIVNAIKSAIEELDSEAGKAIYTDRIAMPFADTPTVCEDPAIRLMVHQLAFLVNHDALDSRVYFDPKVQNYSEAMAECERRAA